MTNNRTLDEGGHGSRARAQSSVIGVVLLTGVVILSISAIGVFWLGSITDQADASGPLVDVDANVTEHTVELNHRMGDSVRLADLTLLLRNGSSTERYAVDQGNVSGGDGDDRFDPGEDFLRRHAMGTGPVELVLIHESSNSVLHRERFDVRPGGPSATPTTASFTVSPGDPEPRETQTFDASSSTGAGGVQTYQWDWDGDGSVDNTTSSPTIDHAFPSNGVYDVTLVVTDDEGATASTTETIEVDQLRAADSPSDPVNGVNYQYYEADSEYASMPDFGTEMPNRTGVTDGVDLDPAHREDEFAFRFTGYLEVPQDGNYTLSMRSDDGSELYIGDELVVDNGGLHSNRTRSGEIGLEAGMHEITVTMFEHTGDEGLEISWSGPGVTSGTVPASALYRSDAPIATFTQDCVGTECTFDASGSTNPGGSIASFEWSFGDGASASGETVTHTYATTGSTTVTLTVTGDGGGTDEQERTIQISELQPALDPGPVVQGVEYRYFEAVGDYTALSDVDWSSPTRTGTTDGIDLDPSHRADDFAFEYETYFDAPTNGSYTFYTTSDDGSVLYVDGQRVVDNRGLHASEEASGRIDLEEGYHNVTVRYFEHEGQVDLSASYEVNDGTRQLLPADRLYRPRQSVRWSTAADWDAVLSQRGVVHEGYGDRRADAVELGYPSGGQWGPTPIAFWPLDEDSGTTTVDVVGGNDGTVEGATPGVPGTLGTTAYDFDAGNQEYVGGATDLAALRGTATVSVWINTTQTGSDTMWQAPGITGVESSGDGDDVFWGWIDSSGRISIQAGNGAPATSTSAVNDGQWHHVVMTRDHSTGEVEVYVDGQREDVATSATGEVSTTFSSIGRIEDTGGTPEYFDGRIEDLAVYDRVVSAENVSDLYNVSRDGVVVSDVRTFDVAVDPSTLSLRNVSATLPAGTGATVTVYSDANSDGIFEEQSDPISLSSGSAEYSINGLTTRSNRYLVVVEVETSDPTASPQVARLVIGE